MFQAAATGKAKYCLAPIENTLAGSVYENYDLLLEHDLHIIGEVNLRIVHNLIAAPGTTFKNLRQVYSHPVALAQCSNFFHRYSRLEKIQFYDTAGAVKMITQKQLVGAAAIASRAAPGCTTRASSRPTWKIIGRTTRGSCCFRRPPVFPRAPTRFQ